MRSLQAPDSLSPFSRIRQPQAPGRGLPQTNPLSGTSAPQDGSADRSRSISSSDSATFSRDGQALLDRPEDQNKKVLSLLDQMFGITNVTSMSLQIDVSKVHAQQFSSSERQRSDASGLTYDYQDSALLADSTAMRAAGTIELADGRSFQLDLHYEHTAIVTSERSLHLETPDSEADLSGTGKQVLDHLFSPEAIQQHLGDALRQLQQASQPDSSSAPSLIATLEASAMSTKALNSVFNKLRDQRQHQLADLYQPKPDAENKFAALAS